MKELFETLNNYISSRSYFSKYVLMYMIERCGVEGWRDIYNWNLTKEWLIVEYYSEETDNTEDLNLPIKDFFEYIKSKQNESNLIFDAVLRYWQTIFSQRIDPVDKNNCPKPKFYYFDF